ncbi:hypothetical protein MBLNU13_g04463t1 [Cladosporium sp. NU13]
MATKPQILSLYRRSLKLALDWAVHRYVWRGQALYIRGLFEANKHVTEPRQQRTEVRKTYGQMLIRRLSQLIVEETESLLEKWKHPDPYRAPTAPGGSKYERNLPVPSTEPPPHMHL